MNHDPPKTLLSTLANGVVVVMENKENKSDLRFEQEDDAVWVFSGDSHQGTEISHLITSHIDDYNEDDVRLICHYAANEIDRLRAKLAKATPEGFVLMPKDELTTTYHWGDAEYVVNCVSEYEMELAKGEIAELEKWEQTKSTKAFFANIYSDEDNFKIFEFDSIEAAQLAIKENKAMIEAQEQK